MTLRIGRLAAWGAAVVAGVALLLAPAWWNGFPLIFYDTAGYIERGMDGNLSPGRSLVYGEFAYALLRLGPGLWPVAVAQSLLVLWLLHLVARTHGMAHGPAALVGLAAILGAGTGIAWYAGQVMPDIFAALVVLGLYLLACQWTGLRGVERLSVGVIVAFGIAAHMSHLGLAVGLVVPLALVTLVLGRRAAALRLRVAMPALVVVAGTGLLILGNGLRAGHYGFTPGGQTFVFARLVHDGIVARFLADRCPAPRPPVCQWADSMLIDFDPGDPAVRLAHRFAEGVVQVFFADHCVPPDYRLCQWRESMPTTADDWLWGGGSPLWRIGGWDNGAEEMQRITVESLREYPWLHVTTALGSTLEQLVMFRTGDGLDPNMPFIASFFDRRMPALAPAYHAARQQRGALSFELLNQVQVPLAAGAMILSVALLPWCLWRGEAELAALLGCVLATLFGNAVICGVLSNPHDRYQNRVAWLAVLGVIVVLDAAWRRRRDRGVATAETASAGAAT